MFEVGDAGEIPGGADGIRTDLGGLKSCFRMKHEKWMRKRVFALSFLHPK